MSLRAVQAMIAASTPAERTSSPERLLMVSLLEDAVTVFCRYRGRSQAPRSFVDARRWLEMRDERWPFSFDRVCDALDLDPSSVRRALHLKAKQPLRAVR